MKVIFYIFALFPSYAAQHQDIEDDQEIGLQKVEAELGVGTVPTTEAPMAKNALPMLPPLPNNDSWVSVQITDKGNYAFVTLATFNELSKNTTFRRYNKKLLNLGADESERENGSGLGSGNGINKTMHAGSNDTKQGASVNVTINNSMRLINESGERGPEIANENSADLRSLLKGEFL